MAEQIDNNDYIDDVSLTDSEFDETDSEFDELDYESNGEENVLNVKKITSDEMRYKILERTIPLSMCKLENLYHVDMYDIVKRIMLPSKIISVYNYNDTAIISSSGSQSATITSYRTGSSGTVISCDKFKDRVEKTDFILKCMKDDSFNSFDEIKEIVDTNLIRIEEIAVAFICSCCCSNINNMKWLRRLIKMQLKLEEIGEDEKIIRYHKTVSFAFWCMINEATEDAIKWMFNNIMSKCSGGKHIITQYAYYCNIDIQAPDFLTFLSSESCNYHSNLFTGNKKSLYYWLLHRVCKNLENKKIIEGLTKTIIMLIYKLIQIACFNLSNTGGNDDEVCYYNESMLFRERTSEYEYFSHINSKIAEEIWIDNGMYDNSINDDDFMVDVPIEYIITYIKFIQLHTYEIRKYFAEIHRIFNYIPSMNIECTSKQRIYQILNEIDKKCKNLVYKCKHDCETVSGTYEYEIKLFDTSHLYRTIASIKYAKRWIWNTRRIKAEREFSPEKLQEYIESNSETKLEEAIDTFFSKKLW